MLLEENQDIIVLRPQKADLYQEYSHEAIIIGNVLFNKYNAKIVSFPYVDKMQEDMCIADVKFGFRNGNYGSYIQIVDTEHIPISFRLLLTWNDVLNGCSIGIQVWRKGTTYRDVYSNFHNARRNPDNIFMLSGFLLAL